MSIRTKILLSVVSVAIINALAIGAVTVFNTTSNVVVAASVSAFCGALAVFIGLYVANNIAKPLNAAVDMIRDVSRGHLGTRLNLNRDDEIGVMAKAMNALANNLRINVIGAINKIALGDLRSKTVLSDDEDEITAALKLATKSLRKLIVDDGGMVLAAAAERDLSRRLTGVYCGDFAIMKDLINAVVQDFDDTLRLAAENAVSQVSGAGFLEEASQTIKAMSTMTTRNADSTKQAKLLADEERAAASEGDAAVKRVAEAVNQIKASSDNTAKIIKAINDLTAEANLLAFNVDIEAAHAGKAGITRVAAEARDLATHCAEAAKSAANIIEKSVKNADDGVKMTEDAEKSISQIVDCAGIVDDLIAEIAETSSKQAQSIKQVSTAVSQMSQIVQRNITGDFAPNAIAQEPNAEKRLGHNPAVSAKPKQYASISNKRAYKPTTFGIMTPVRTVTANEVFTIEDCELLR